MIVEELILNLMKQNPKNEVLIESQDGENLLGVWEVTNGKCVNGETFTVIVTDNSVGKGDYISPLK